MSCFRRATRLSASEELPSYEAVVSEAAARCRVRHVRIVVNGVRRDVAASLWLSTLAEYLREHLRLTGTKESCREGGCGACTVLLSWRGTVRAVNACLRLVVACDGCEIVTNEGLGSADSPHPVQQAIVDCDATQCGMCTSGVVCSLTRALEAGTDVEEALDGTICRCTGYQRIVAAARSVDTVPPIMRCATTDIEDLCDTIDAPRYYVPTTIDDACSALLSEDVEAVVVGANTGNYGVAKYYDGQAIDRVPAPQQTALVDVSRIEEMTQIVASPEDGSLSIGAASTIEELLEACQKHSHDRFATLASHLRRVANTQVRSVGTIGGNLWLSSQFPDFASDLRLLFSALDAVVLLVDKTTRRRQPVIDAVPAGLLIVRIDVPPARNEIFLSHKLAQRHRNAHAICHAALRLCCDHNGNVAEARFVFGGGLENGGVMRATAAGSSVGRTTSRI